MKKIYRFKEIDSTQDKARELVAQKDREAVVVVAVRQTGGKGRFGREWLSPGGGLWFSMVLYPEISPEDAPKLTMLAGVAVVEAIKLLCGVELKIKWPNDIVFHEGREDMKKVGGILTETVLSGKKIDSVIMGMGINVNNEMEGVDVPAISIKQITGRKTSVKGLMNEILKQFDNHYLVFKKSGIGPVWEKCRKLSAITGRKVIVDRAEGIIEGVVTDIQEDGALVLKANGKEVVILAGDIKILRY